MAVRHLNQMELARRWSISPRTLERWRWLGQGPVYLKLGGRVSYRLDDVEKYEARRLHANTTGPLQTETNRSEADLDIRVREGGSQ
jgi:predicted site-specific integrase-resolvase